MLSDVQTFLKDGMVWYLASDVTRLFGYSQPKVAVTKLLKGLHQQLAGDLCLPGANKRQRVITLTGVRVIAAKSTKPNSLAICKELGIDVATIKCALKETESLAEIIGAFDGEKMLHQFCVGPYRLDLYFEEYNLAIECDENGHRDYSAEKELNRTQFITHHLRCDWIRFNPDGKDFRVCQVINRIFRHIKSRCK